MAFTNWLNPRIRVHLDKPITTQLVKKFLAFYGIRKFITVLTRTRHWLLSWATCVHSTSSHPISLLSIQILSSHLRLGLPSGLFLSGFPTKILLCISTSLPCVLHAPLIPSALIHFLLEFQSATYSPNVFNLCSLVWETKFHIHKNNREKLWFCKMAFISPSTHYGGELMTKSGQRRG
jgi:hypothetical protein